MRRKTLTGLAALLSHSLATAAPPPTPLTPTGPWNVEFADSMCLLGRPFGPDRASHLILKPAMLGNSLEIIVTRATSRVDAVRFGEAKLLIEGRPSSAESHFTAYNTRKGRVLRISIKEDTLALAAVRGTLAIDAKREGRYAFAIPGIDRALPILSNCLDQLRTAWKVSKTDLAMIVTQPEPKPGGDLPRLFSSKDYPDEAIRTRQGGTVGVLVWIEATGRISTCQVIESSVVPVLDKTTCDILIKRGRFTPAKDSAGRSVRAPSFTRVRWAIPQF